MESDSQKNKNRKETAGNILLNEIYSRDSQGDKETGHIMRFDTKYNLQGNSEGGGGGEVNFVTRSLYPDF